LALPLPGEIMSRTHGTINIQELFPDGKWESSTEYCISCPYCGDAKDHSHCFVSIVKGIFHCFYCGEAGSITKLINDHADRLATTPEYDSAVPTYKEVDAPVVKEIEFENFRRVPLLEQQPADEFSLGHKAWRYLHERGLSDIEIHVYDIRYVPTGRYAGRVIIPVKEAGSVVCFSARSFLDSAVKPKYLFPAKGETILSASDSIFNYEKIENPTRSLQTVVITEGIFDAIAVERLRLPDTICVSTLSKNITDAQAKKLLATRVNRKFIIMFDSVVKDANIKHDIGRAAKILVESVADVDVFVAILPTNDPAASTREEIYQAINKAGKFTYMSGMELAMATNGKKIKEWPNAAK
jgi:hypothetical protein